VNWAPEGTNYPNASFVAAKVHSPLEGIRPSPVPYLSTSYHNLDSIFSTCNNGARTTSTEISRLIDMPEIESMELPVPTLPSRSRNEAS